MNLSGRHALITGASSGIGKQTAIRLAAEGAAVCIDYATAHQAASAQEVVDTITKSGGRAVAVQCDVSDEEQVIALVKQTVEQLGDLDILVNNAGVERQFPLIEMPLSEWNRVLSINLTGAFLCMREAAKAMIARPDAGAVGVNAGTTAAGRKGGTIVNVSSVHEFIPWPGFAHYCASKGAMKMLMGTAARELAPHGIRVVNVAPGAIATPINEGVLENPHQKHAVESEIPLGRFGQPDEIARTIAWAASDEASYVTGTTLVADGGMSVYPKFV